MEKIGKEADYWQLVEALKLCKKSSDEELVTYEKLVELCEKAILGFEEDVAAFAIDSQDEETMEEDSSFLDDYIAPMDNLARIYMKRGEYEKALPLLERVLPVYRTLEINNPNFTYQRYYAQDLMMECMKHLGQKSLAILYEYELKHLKRDVLDKREK